MYENYTPYSYSTTVKKQFAPDVMDALRPSAEAIIEVVRADQQKPAYGPVNESREYKIKKARCVHRIASEDPQYRGVISLKRRIRPMEDGTLRCELCGAKIRHKFDDSMVKSIEDAVEVIDTLIAFGPDLYLCNIDPKHPEERGLIDRMIDTKEFFDVHLKKIVKSFIEIAKQDKASHENERNLAKEYLDKTKSATSWM